MPDSPDILMRYVLEGRYASQTTQTTFWLRSKPNAVTDDVEVYINEILDEIEAFIFTFIQTCATSEWQIITAQIQVLAGALPYQTIRPYTTKYGLQSPDALPPHDAGLLSFYTPFHGRRNHGRIYIPAMPEVEHVGGLLSDVQLQRIDNLGSVLLSRFGDNGTSPRCWLCVFSKANGVQRQLLPVPHLVYDPLSAIPITKYVPHREVATQRHRKRGRGI